MVTRFIPVPKLIEIQVTNVTQFKLGIVHFNIIVML